MTPEQRTAKNAAGETRGCSACPGCGDSRAWKSFHETPYFEEVLDLGDKASANGTLSVGALCDECWQALSPPARLPHYMVVVDRWIAVIPSVVRVPVAGDIVDDPADAARHAADVAKLEATRAVITAAVLEGK